MKIISVSFGLHILIENDLKNCHLQKYLFSRMKFLVIDYCESSHYQTLALLRCTAYPITHWPEGDKFFSVSNTK